MRKVTVTKNIRIGGRLYRTGDAAPVSRAHARVLQATKLATPYVAPKARPAKPAPAATTQESPAPEHAHNAPTEYPHTAQAAAAHEASASRPATASTSAPKARGDKIGK